MLPAAVLITSMLAGCTATRDLRPGFRPAEVEDLAFLAPQSAIAIIRTDYQTTVDSQATATSAQLLHRALVRHRFQLRLHHELPLPDSLRLAARQEIYRAVAGIQRHPRLAGGANLPVLDYLLAAQPQRYLLVTAAAGFTQEITKYDLQRAQGISVGQRALVRTAGPQPVATRAKSALCLFIYDRQQHAIVYYTYMPPLIGHEPLNEAGLEEQLSQLLRKDFPVPSK